jgi:hypothetical protein
VAYEDNRDNSEQHDRLSLPSSFRRFSPRSHSLCDTCLFLFKIQKVFQLFGNQSSFFLDFRDLPKKKNYLAVLSPRVLLHLIHGCQDFFNVTQSMSLLVLRLRMLASCKTQIQSWSTIMTTGLFLSAFSFLLVYLKTIWSLSLSSVRNCVL